MVEADTRITARHPAGLLPRLLGIPLRLGTELAAIEGRDRVEAVVLRSVAGEERLAADGVIVTGRFRPEATLIREGNLVLDPGTGGPEVDEYGRTSDPGIFAAGNLLRPVETAGWCWKEGRAVARAIARALRGALPPPAEARVRIGTVALRFVVPQRIAGGDAPALDRLQIRAAAPASGRLALRMGGQEIAGRTTSLLPERRFLLPLPAAGDAVSVTLEPRP